MSAPSDRTPLPNVPVSQGGPPESATLPPAVPSEGETLPPVDPGLTAAPAGMPTGVPTDADGDLHGDRLGVPGYEIVRELGRGGMGIVYMARQTALNRTVALKMILSGGHASPADLERFRTEAEAIARVQHPHIVQVFEVGRHGGLPFFSLEFCPGGSLEKKLAGTPLPPREAAALVQRLAHAVQAAHRKGIIHRDLKPANVLLTEDGLPKITDFGLAKKLDEAGKTATGAVMGTPSYMAPEQASGETKKVGPAADVYALGAMLYECLTGRPPFRGPHPLDTILQVLSDPPVPPLAVDQGDTPRPGNDLSKVFGKEPGATLFIRGGLAGRPAAVSVRSAHSRSPTGPARARLVLVETPQPDAGRGDSVDRPDALVHAFPPA